MLWRLAVQDIIAFTKLISILSYNAVLWFLLPRTGARSIPLALIPAKCLSVIELGRIV